MWKKYYDEHFLINLVKSIFPIWYNLMWLLPSRVHWPSSVIQGDSGISLNRWTPSSWSKWRMVVRLMEPVFAQVINLSVKQHKINLVSIRWSWLGKLLRSKEFHLFFIEHPSGDRLVKVNGASIIGKAYCEVISLIQERWAFLINWHFLTAGVFPSFLILFFLFASTVGIFSNFVSCLKMRIYFNW